MNSLFPQWFIDLSTFSSFIGLIVTAFLFYEAKQIRKSFLRRARLPEITRKLGNISKKISNGLKEWDTSQNFVNEQYSIVRGLLENIAPKLPNDEKVQMLEFINKLKKRTNFFWSESRLIENEDQGWKLYTDLSRIVTRLEQLQKDSKWD